MGDEVVQVERGDGLPPALELDGAHAAVDTGATAGKHRIDQGAEAVEVVGAGLLGLTHHIHRDAAQFAQAGIELDVVEHRARLLAQGGFEVFDLHAVQVDDADFGQADLAVAVKRLVARKVDRSPNLDANFVAGAEHVFCRSRCSGNRGVGIGVVKQLLAKMGQQLAGAGLDKTLKLGGRFGLFGLGQSRNGRSRLNVSLAQVWALKVWTLDAARRLNQPECCWLRCAQYRRLNTPRDRLLCRSGDGVLWRKLRLNLPTQKRHRGQQKSRGNGAQVHGCLGHQRRH